ncbi:uncharacterized protein LOC100206770 [Hydra vulgaris]|uniref:uncharacterized protein LOC100206770 n=1 Tax=Hydra vulgaris TaxID=6087 RepID=UPI001F5E77F0|nr:uncharacterized protein LOC100206770 [Hydra vulgaris]
MLSLILPSFLYVFGLYYGKIYANYVFIFALSISYCNGNQGSVYTDDIFEAGKFLKNFDVVADELLTKNGLANWQYETDLTEDNLQKTVDIGLELSDFFLSSSQNASKLKVLDLPQQMQRQIMLIRRSADPTSEDMRREIKETIGQMTSIFSKAKVKKDSVEYSLENLTEIMRTSRNKKKLDWAWRSWRDTVGPPIKSLYTNMIDLLNIGAREHGWIDYGDFLRTDYEMGDDFEISLDMVWSKIKPLYEELHAYVRYMLTKKKIIKVAKDGCIPASVLGDMFAQNWENIFDLVKPSKTSKVFDVTKTLKEKNYTVQKMFTLAEDFFISLGLYKMPTSFWNNSVFTKPKNKDMVCHASAWDISSTDVRIKMCAEVNQNDLTTIHHEMGHIEYFLAYKNQPNTFRAGANPGFHEAIGDTISLSVETPTYLKKVNLLKKEKWNKDETISFLLNQALRRLAPLPYNLLVDKWRWRVFEGNITENNYNKAWWDFRVEYQGIEPPVSRPPNAFDPASKFHIGANVPYVAYFFSYILQFQLHKKLCRSTKFSGPLYLCSIYNEKEAGNILKKMLEKGRSKPWPQVLKEATGEKELNPDAILEYFKPLHTWLEKQRKTKKYDIKWKRSPLTKVFQKTTKKYELGQERSGILKTDSGDVSLSINIPAFSLAQLMGNNKVQNSTTVDSASSSPSRTVSENNLQLDLSKLLASGKSFSIKSSETNTINSEGNTEIKNKEININSESASFKAPSKVELPLQAFNNASVDKTVPLAAADKTVPIAALDKTAPMAGIDKTVPLAAEIKPDAPFPLTATSLTEEKNNPIIAGLEKQKTNPIAAAFPQEVKPNPVPENQIALVPISLPSNLLNILRNALNSSGLERSEKNIASFSDSQLKSSNNSSTNHTTELTNNNQTSAKNDPLNSTATLPGKNSEAVNSTLVKDVKGNNTLIGVDKLIQPGNEDLNNSSKVSPQNFMSMQQLVLPCKRSDIPCVFGKIVTEGNSIPSFKEGLDAEKKTVSISPSLLIKKLIEHHVADKSTPDPVVNAVPLSLPLGQTSQGLTLGSQENNQGNFDLNQIIKALTGAIKPLNKNDTSPADTKQTILQASAEAPKVTIKSNEDLSKITNAVNCSNIQKRGVRLTIKCNEGKHKGGMLSLTPQEIVQRLINSKNKNELNKKTIPGANVINTPNGFQLNFDLIAKDQIPYDLTEKPSNPSARHLTSGRQQHVDVFNTAKGMVVKPKSSIQLLTPQFVPALDKDNIELRKSDK